MMMQNIIEIETEYCVICEQRKSGNFLIINVANKYIPICEKCQKEPVSKDWLKHISDKGFSKPDYIPESKS